MKRWIWKVLLLCGVLLCGCTAEEEPSVQTTDVTGTIRIYYTNETATTLQEERAVINPDLETDEQINQLLTLLKNPPEGESSIIPESLRLTYRTEQSESTGQMNIKMYVWGNYEALQPNVENVFRVGIMKSLIHMDNVGVVELFAMAKNEEGISVQTRKSYLTQDTIILNEADENFFQDNVEVKLYFMDKSSTSLVMETRRVTVQMQERLVDKVVSMLIAGPTSDTCQATMPEGTAVNEILLRHNICYVDLNEAFVRNYLGGELSEQLVVYSLVNSLTSCYGVDSVQILINGQQREYYKSEVKINIPLQFNEELVQTP